MSLQQSLTTIARLWCWIDADPSGLVWTGLDCDDDLAILTALALKDTLSVVRLSICGGNAPLRHTWNDSQQRLLGYVDSSIKPVQGYSWRTMQISKKRWLRILSWLVQDSEGAADAIIKASHEVPDLTVLTLGPPTNLARALIKDPSLATRLHRVVMMGGELTNQRLDLNFATDRGAARTVVDANVHLTLVPIQLCAQAIVDAAFVSKFEKNCCPNAAACAILPKMRQQVALMPTAVNKAVSKRFPEGSPCKSAPISRMVSSHAGILWLSLSFRIQSSLMISNGT
jgi:inosine-uridine nucleoside N-ribohydrolase